jgi:putative FmdB family regulatory protein
VPTYAYACTACDHRFEIAQSFTEDSLTECPQCRGRLRKVFNAVGVVFKGSGFYRNDSRNDSRRGRSSGRGAGNSGKDQHSGSGTTGGHGSSSESTSSSSDSASSTSSDSSDSAGITKTATKPASKSEGSAA